MPAANPIAVHRIIFQRVGARDDHATRGTGQCPQPVEAAEALSQRIEAGALGDEAVEIEVGPRLDGLRRNDDNRPVASASGAPRADAHEKAVFDRVPVERPHPTGQQVDVTRSVRNGLAKAFVQVARGLDAIDDDSDSRPGAIEHRQDVLRELFRKPLGIGGYERDGL